MSNSFKRYVSAESTDWMSTKNKLRESVVSFPRKFVKAQMAKEKNRQKRMKHMVYILETWGSQH